MSIDEQFAELMQRPDLDQAALEYQELQDSVRVALRDAFALPEWEKGGGQDMRTPGCVQLPDLGGWDVGSVHLQNWVTEGGIGYDRWPEAQATLRSVVGERGFTTVTVDMTQGTTLAYELMNDWGAKIRLMSKPSGNTVLSMATGCHLRAAAKERGRPIPKEERREMSEDERREADGLGR